MSHYVCYTDSEGREKRQPIPDGNYGVGHMVTAASGRYKITGVPHHEWFGAKFAACDVSWPGEPIDSIPPLLTRGKD